MFLNQSFGNIQFCYSIYWKLFLKSIVPYKTFLLGLLNIVWLFGMCIQCTILMSLHTASSSCNTHVSAHFKLLVNTQEADLIASSCQDLIYQILFWWIQGHLWQILGKCHEGVSPPQNEQKVNMKFDHPLLHEVRSKGHLREWLNSRGHWVMAVTAASCGRLGVAMHGWSKSDNWMYHVRSSQMSSLKWYFEKDDTYIYPQSIQYSVAFIIPPSLISIDLRYL